MLRPDTSQIPRLLTCRRSRIACCPTSTPAAAPVSRRRPHRSRSCSPLHHSAGRPRATPKIHNRGLLVDQACHRRLCQACRVSRRLMSISQAALPHEARVATAPSPMSTNSAHHNPIKSAHHNSATRAQPASISSVPLRSVSKTHPSATNSAHHRPASSARPRSIGSTHHSTFSSPNHCPISSFYHLPARNTNHNSTSSAHLCSISSVRPSLASSVHHSHLDPTLPQRPSRGSSKSIRSWRAAARM